MYHRGVTFNPYAPPDDNSQQNAEEGSDAIAGPAQEWTIEEVLRLGWDRVKADWPVLIFAPLLAMGVGQVMGMGGGQIAQRMHISPLSWEALGINFGVSFLAMFVHTYFQGGLLRIMLRAARGQTASFGLLFSGGSVYLKLLAVNLLLFLAVWSGMLLLIVPGVILGLGFSMGQFYVVDAGMGPIAALNASWNATKGHKAHIFGFGFVMFGIMMLSMCTCVGWILVQAVAYVGWAILFTRISGRQASTLDPPSPYGPGGSSGGYGVGPTPPPGGGWGAA